MNDNEMASDVRVDIDIWQQITRGLKCSKHCIHATDLGDTMQIADVW